MKNERIEQLLNTNTTLNKHQHLPSTFNWSGSALAGESTLHQISPYIGKMKSSMASALIREFTKENDTIYDPFCGSGTIALEAWRLKRAIIASDLSPYAVALTKAKLFPPDSLEAANDQIEDLAPQIENIKKKVDLRSTPRWVRNFFHTETLRETIAWTEVLKINNADFLLSCLLGILHHQSLGFLSYPSSHTTPYLKERNFPRQTYPHLYEYRTVKDRLERKVKRVLKRLPILDEKIFRDCSLLNATQFETKMKIQTIITSPPYMRQLDYGRDNRLRLWFLGNYSWKLLDNDITPGEADFVKMFKTCLRSWKNILISTGRCVLVVGDSFSRKYKMFLPEILEKIALEEVGGYSLDWKYTEQIPYNRRVRKSCSGNQRETILVLSRNEV